jgi:hypothetical protein
MHGFYLNGIFIDFELGEGFKETESSSDAPT